MGEKAPGWGLEIFAVMGKVCVCWSMEIFWGYWEFLVCVKSGNYFQDSVQQLPRTLSLLGVRIGSVGACMMKMFHLPNTPDTKSIQTPSPFCKRYHCA